MSSEDPPNSPNASGSRENAENESTHTAKPAPTAMQGAIGRYRLLEKVGEGGMGEVWLAAQRHPIRRRVALKMIKVGMDTEQVIARFEAERQALALMDHVAIAKVFDAGTTPLGRPYFVMEYVAGVPINDHCDGQRLTTRERLELFLQVCDGIQHAHQKAVIHRDLKPSNVLVSMQEGRSIPKIIDFGVAKAIGQPLTERSVHTELGSLIGTPEYMSPEQATLTSEGIDTRTDVYALGVILYQLLSGTLPFDWETLRRAGYEEIWRVLREHDPPKPSARLSTVDLELLAEWAQRRHVDVQGLRRQLRGDLDWITMKAIEKDRARRYGSPAELADDIRRHLRHEPVRAGHPGTSYRMGKFVRRHRLGVTAAVVVLMGLVIGLVGASFGLVRARRAEAAASKSASEARSAAARAQAVSEFLVNDLLAEASPERNPLGSRVTVREVLDRAALKVNTSFEHEPGVEAEVRMAIGDTYRSLGHYTEAESHLQRAVDLRREQFGDDSAETLVAMDGLGVLRQLQGRSAEAEKLLQDTLVRRRRVLGGDHPDTYESVNNLAWSLTEQGKLDEALPVFREALELARRLRGPEHEDTVVIMASLGWVLQSQGNDIEAADLLQQAVDSGRRVLGLEHPRTLDASANLASVMQRQGRLAEAEDLYRQVFESRRHVQGEEHRDTLVAMNNLAAVLRDREKLPEAEVLQRRTVSAFRRTQGLTHPLTLHMENNLALILLVEGKSTEAEAIFRRVLNERRKFLSPDHRHIADSLLGLGEALIANGRATEAESLLRDALSIFVKRAPELKALHGRVESGLGECLAAAGHLVEAESLMHAGYEGLKADPGAAPHQVRCAVKRIVALYDRWPQPAKAESWRAR